MFFKNNANRRRKNTSKTVQHLLKKALLAALGFSLSVTPVLADQPITAGEYLKFNPDPQASGMGGGILSHDYSLGSVFVNPASAAEFVQPRFSFSSSNAMNGYQFQFAGFAVPTAIGSFSAAGATLSNVELKGSDCSGKAYDIASSQSKLVALNYSLPIKELVPVERSFGSFGLTVKGVSTDFAAYTANGLVFDAGCDFKIYDPWFLSGGVTVRNFGQSLSYKNNDSLFPETAEAALKFQDDGLAGLTGVIDGSTSWPDQLYTYSAGASISPVYPLSIRAGWQQSQDTLNSGNGLRGGVGLNFNNVSVNYSIEPFVNSTPLQKISIDIALGGVTSPSLAYDYYLDKNFFRARDSYLRGDYVTARQRFEEILALYPNHQPSKDYLAKIAVNLEDLEKENQKKIGRYLIRGRVALQRKDMLKASRYYGMVLGIDPANAEALEGMRKTDELRKKLEQEENKKKNEKRIIELWSEATSYAGKSDYVSAKGKISELLLLDPENDAAKKYLIQINSKLESISSFEVNELYLKGVSLYNAGKYDDSLKYFESVLVASPDRLDAKNYAEACRKKIQEQGEKQKPAKPNPADLKVRRELDARYQDALRLYDSGQYDAALKSFADLQKSADDSGIVQYSGLAKNYIAKIKNKASEKNLKAAQAYAEKGDLESAYNEYAKALKANPDLEVAKDEQDEVAALLSRKYYERGAKAFSEGNTTNARENFQKALSYKKDNIEAQRALERISGSESSESEK